MKNSLTTHLRLCIHLVHAHTRLFWGTAWVKLWFAYGKPMIGLDLSPIPQRKQWAPFLPVFPQEHVSLAVTVTEHTSERNKSGHGENAACSELQPSNVSESMPVIVPFI